MAAPKGGANLGMIAAALGVSSATVSNALSGKGRVSGELIEKIRKTADELGYVPSPAARALRTGRSSVLGLVLPDIANPLFPALAQAIEQAAGQAGYGVLIADSRGSVSGQTEAMGRLVEHGVDGIVVIPRRGTRISGAVCPTAIIDTPSTPGNTVSADHWQGGEEIARHLSALGHRRIVIIGSDPSSNVQLDRMGGIRSALGAGAVVSPLWVSEVEAKQGRDCPLGLAAWVERGYTAFAALSDLNALRALTELQRGGVSVPEQASVTGFDDLLWSSVVSPALTTVQMNMAAISEIAIAALVRAIETADAGADDAAASMIVSADSARVPMRLVVRQSTRQPAPARALPELQETPAGEQS